MGVFLSLQGTGPQVILIVVALMGMAITDVGGAEGSVRVRKSTFNAATNYEHANGFDMVFTKYTNQ